MRRVRLQSLTPPPSTWRLADRDIGAFLDLRPKRRNGFGRVLKIAVHYGQHIAARRLPTPDDGGGQTALRLTPHNSQSRVLFAQFQRESPRAIRAIVVDDNDLVGTPAGSVQ